MDWFPSPTTRGRWYAVLATSQNAGAAVAPALLTALLAPGGVGSGGVAERVLLVVAGLAGACALLIAVGVKDKAAPAAVAASVAPASKGSEGGGAPATGKVPAAGGGPGVDGSASEKVWAVLQCRPLWLLGANYFCNTFLRNAFTEVPDFLLGSVDAGTKIAALGAYEAAAAVGGFGAGLLSDRVFGGRRGPVMALASVAATAVPVVMLSAAALQGSNGTGAAVTPWLPYPVLYGALGITAFAPHVLNGLAAREVAPAGTTATAGGFAKSLGQLGGALAGWPFVAACNAVGATSTTFRWWVLTVACCAAIATAAPLWNVLPLPGGPLLSAAKPAGESTPDPQAVRHGASGGAPGDSGGSSGMSTASRSPAADAGSPSHDESAALMSTSGGE
jgi:sugar phosphate permease